MFDSIFAKSIWERRRNITWWVLGMVALAGLTVAFYPSIRDDAEQFEDLFDAFPAELLSIFGVDDPAALVTATGLVNSRLYAGIGPVIMAALGISLGTAAIAGEEERGTLGLLLSQPVTRTQVLVEKAVAGAVLVAFVALALFLTLSALNPLVDLDFGFWGILSANVALWLFAVIFMSLALAVGAVTGNRGMTLGISAGTAGALFFINGLAPLVDATSWLQKLTPYYWLQDPNPLANGLDVAATVIFVVVIALLMTLATWGFNRRDIGV